MRPTYEDLLAAIERLEARIQLLEEENARLRKENAELKERLGLNSSNSSKPPSTDQKKNKEKPKGGALKGHQGHFRKLSDRVDKHITSKLSECHYCGSRNLHRRDSQFFDQVDLPKINPFVTRIECCKYRCRDCGRKQVASFPEGFDKTSFGPKLISFISLCSSAYRMSKRTTQGLLKNLLNVDIALGSLPSMEKKISKALNQSFESLKKKVSETKVAYVDETSFREQAQTCYVWTATTEKEVLLQILPTRGLQSLDQVRPRSHPGITVTDRYQVYDYKRHQYCLAHLYRDFKKFAQRDGPEGQLGTQALFEMNEIFLATRQPCRKTMQGRVGYRKEKLRSILEDAIANGSDQMSRFAGRLLDHYEKLFLFTRYQGVEATNNAAERSLRHIVVWRKTSYGTQSEEGSQFMERAVSVWMTLKRQGRDILSFFEEAYCSSFDRRVEAPSI
jgi:transposase